MHMYRLKYNHLVLKKLEITAGVSLVCCKIFRPGQFVCMTGSLYFYSSSSTIYSPMGDSNPAGPIF